MTAEQLSEDKQAEQIVRMLNRYASENDKDWSVKKEPNSFIRIKAKISTKDLIFLNRLTSEYKLSYFIFPVTGNPDFSHFILY